MFKRIAILGAGLLGASVMRTARARGLAERIVAWSRSAETRAFCDGKPWCDAVFATPAECVRDADLIIVCVPADKIAATLAAVAPALKPGALVTDVGSTKAGICRDALAALAEFPAVTFVGSHPMAGSEKSGPEHATDDLFDNRICFVAPDEKTPADAVEKIVSFWEKLGMRVVKTNAGEHDEIVAHVSHLPHLVASTLSFMLAEKPVTWGALAGPGLRDTTRVAGGDPAMWRAILSENKNEILSAIREFQNSLGRLETLLAGDDFDAIRARLQHAKDWRDALPKNKF